MTKRYQPVYCFMCKPEQLFVNEKDLHAHMKEKHQAAFPFAKSDDLSTYPPSNPHIA